MKTLRCILLSFVVLLTGACLFPSDAPPPVTAPAPAPVEEKKLSTPTLVSPTVNPYKSDVFLKETRNGEKLEIRPYYPNGNFQYLFVDYRDGSWTMWINSGLFVGSKRDTRTEHFTSEDGLLWHDRTDTNLAREGIPYNFVVGPRQILFDGEIYQAWEEMYPTDTFGWGKGVRYETSTDGLHWKIESEPALIGARFPSACKTGGLYHLWAVPDGDNNPDFRGGYKGIEALRHRISETPGSGWGDWETGGEWVTIDGEKIKTLTRVRCLPDGRFEIFYIDGSYDIARAISNNGALFETRQKSLVHLRDLPGFTDLLSDFIVVNVTGKYRYYITYRDDQKRSHVAVLESSQR